MLHRPPDAPGFQYWNTATANGMQANEMLATFSESTENVNSTAVALKNGIRM